MVYISKVQGKILMFSKVNAPRRGRSGTWNQEEVCIRSGKLRGRLSLSLVTAEVECPHITISTKQNLVGTCTYFNSIPKGLGTE